MAKKQRDVAKERRWREVMRRFARSKLSVRAFCQSEKLAESAFYFWRRELAQRDGKAPASQQMLNAAPTLPNFLPARVTDAALHQASIALELIGGRVLRLPASMPVQRIAELVLALEAPSLVAEDAR